MSQRRTRKKDLLPVTRCEEAGGEAGGEDERDQEGQIAGYKGSHGGARCRGGNTVLLL